MDHCVRSDVQISITKRFANKIVVMVSNKEGIKKDQKEIQVTCPFSVQQYKKNMGGVDILDRLRSLYRISAKTRKWTAKMIMHFFDFAIFPGGGGGGSVEYRKQQSALDILDCFSFRMKYEEFLSFTEQETSTDEDNELEFLILQMHSAKDMYFTCLSSQKFHTKTDAVQAVITTLLEYAVGHARCFCVCCQIGTASCFTTICDS
ncbi:hypothetical protein PR048_000759, partial [Dryococelus australis]